MITSLVYSAFVFAVIVIIVIISMFCALTIWRIDLERKQVLARACIFLFKSNSNQYSFY